MVRIALTRVAFLLWVLGLLVFALGLSRATAPSNQLIVLVESATLALFSLTTFVAAQCVRSEQPDKSEMEE
jgi:hypothetical protein